jgi:hypothetical protein
LTWPAGSPTACTSGSALRTATAPAPAGLHHRAGSDKPTRRHLWPCPVPRKSCSPPGRTGKTPTAAALPMLFPLIRTPDKPAILGSQTGSHRSQTSGDARQSPAPINAADRLTWPHQATCNDASTVPSKQRVAGSSPARRTQLLRSVGAISEICRGTSRRLAATTCHFRARWRAAVLAGLVLLHQLPRNADLTRRCVDVASPQRGQLSSAQLSSAQLSSAQLSSAHRRLAKTGASATDRDPIPCCRHDS